MTRVELDMNFPVEELAAGFEGLFRRQGLEWTRSDPARDSVTFETRIEGSAVRIDICPMPIERLAPFAFPPRTLVTVASDAPPAVLERFRKDILFAFLRVAG